MDMFLPITVESTFFLQRDEKACIFCQEGKTERRKWWSEERSSRPLRRHIQEGKYIPMTRLAWPQMVSSWQRGRLHRRPSRLHIANTPVPTQRTDWKLGSHRQHMLGRENIVGKRPLLSSLPATWPCSVSVDRIC